MQRELDALQYQLEEVEARARSQSERALTEASEQHATEKAKAVNEVRHQCRKELREALRRVAQSNENVIAQQTAAINAERTVEHEAALSELRRDLDARYAEAEVRFAKEVEAARSEAAKQAAAGAAAQAAEEAAATLKAVKAAAEEEKASVVSRLEGKYEGLLTSEREQSMALQAQSEENVAEAKRAAEAAQLAVQAAHDRESSQAATFSLALEEANENARIAINEAHEREVAHANECEQRIASLESAHQAALIAAVEAATVEAEREAATALTTLRAEMNQMRDLDAQR